jgi:hypothetical protein
MTPSKRPRKIVKNKKVISTTSRSLPRRMSNGGKVKKMAKGGCVVRGM